MPRSHVIEEQQQEEESYFVSMTDMMVGLLFIFILMLMYFALQLQDKAEELHGVNNTRAAMLRDIEKQLKDMDIKVSVDPESGVLRFSENDNSLRFESGSAEIPQNYAGTISKLAVVLDNVLPCYSNLNSYQENNCTTNKKKHWLEAVFIEGHTDNTPYLPYGNLKLSTDRAANTYDALVKSKQRIEQLVNPDVQPLVSVSGYGDKRPLLEAKDNATPEQRGLNRRIEMRFIMATPKSATPEPIKDISDGLNDGTR